MSVRMMEEGGSYVRDYKGLLYCTAMLAVTAYTRLILGPIVSLSVLRCSASAWGPPRIVYYIYHIRAV
jgi:hypothetical protein